jgi:intracellular sulfur oxidation DsrE/DsrF family protein
MIPPIVKVSRGTEGRRTPPTGGRMVQSRRRIALDILLWGGLLLTLAGSIAMAWRQARAEGKQPHRLVFHVTENDSDKMAMVLNNIANAEQFYSARGEVIEIEVVAIGPGLNMLREDTSPVKARVKALAESSPHVTFSACENTRQGMKKREGKEIPLVVQAKPVPSGIVRLVELQEQGWTYARP